MKNTFSSEQNQQEKSKQREKANQGFYKRRRGVYEHIMDGTIDLLEDGIHDFLCLSANLVIGGDSSKPAGVCSTSAPAIHAHCRRVSERTIQRCLEHLESIGWIRTFRTPNQRGNYPVLICRATVHNLAGKEYRVNAYATDDWQHPVYEPVGQLSPETSNSGAYKRSKSKEKRVSRYDRRQLSLSGKVWKELKIHSVPVRYAGFVKLVEANPRGEGGDFLTWARRIMDICNEQGIRYAEIFFKRFKEAEGAGERKDGGTSTYSVDEVIYG